MVSKKNVSYAGFGARFIAAIVDTLLFYPISWIISRISFSLPVGVFKIAFILLVINIVVDALYEIILTSRFGGTLGKLLMRIEVTNDSGSRISLSKSTARYFSKWLSALLLGIGFLMILWDEKKRGLHDKIAKTLVVNTQKSKITPKMKTFAVSLTLLFVAGYLFYLATVFAINFKIAFYSVDPDDPLKSLNENCNSKLFWQRDICTQILLENEAFDDFALSKRVSSCMEIRGKTLRSQCLSRLAALSGNKSICSQGLSGYYTNYCLAIYNSVLGFVGNVSPYMDPELKKKAGDYISSIPKDFDEMFKNFQKINQKFSILSSMYLDNPSQIQIANSHLKDIDFWIKDAKSKNKKINDEVAALRELKLTKKSLEKLDELDAISGQYLESLKNLELANEGYRNYIDYLGLQAELFKESETFTSHNDLANTYIDEEKYTKALEELDKAIAAQGKIVSIRKTQLENMDDYKMEFIARLYNEEVKYTEFIQKKKEELQLLIANPKIPKSQRFLESDKIYDEYNEVYIGDTEYSQLLDEWFYNNIGTYLEKSDEILTEADIDYNTYMKDHTFYWE